MDSNLIDKINQVKDTKWDYISRFTVQLFPAADTIDGIAKEAASSLDDLLFEYTEIALISINTPDLTYSIINEYIAGEWQYTPGRLELQRFNLTFRDFNGFSLYTAFKEFYYKVQNAYPNEQKWVISVSNPEDTEVFRTDQAMLESISNISFNQSTAGQIAEFSTVFVTKPVK